MALKASLIVSMLFLCGGLFVIPPAVSIRCYYMACHGKFCCGQKGEVDCEGADNDRCGTLTLKTGIIHNVLRNCSRSTLDCNKDISCSRAAEFMAGLGFSSISHCAITCCEGDVCNAPEEGPKPPVAIHDGKKAIKTYRIVSGRKKSSQLELPGKKKYSETVKSAKEKLAKLVSSIRF